jgi:hypothetical protein
MPDEKGRNDHQVIHEVNGLKGKENSVGLFGCSKTKKELSKITNKIPLLQVPT